MGFIGVIKIINRNFRICYKDTRKKSLVQYTCCSFVKQELPGWQTGAPEMKNSFPEMPEFIIKTSNQTIL